MTETSPPPVPSDKLANFLCFSNLFGEPGVFPGLQAGAGWRSA